MQMSKYSKCSVIVLGQPSDINITVCVVLP